MLEFQSLRLGDSENDSVWTELARRRVFGHLSAVRRRWPLLSAPASPTSRHATHGCLRRDLHSLRALHSHRFHSRRAPPCFGELSRPLHHVSGQASPPRALPRRPSLSLSRALVRPHCPLRRELHLAGVRRGHQRRDQTSLLHHSFSFLFLELPLDPLMLSMNLNWDGIGGARRRTARSAAEPPFTPASPLELGRVRVSHLGRSALVRGSRWCPRNRPRPRRRRALPCLCLSVAWVPSISRPHLSATVSLPSGLLFCRSCVVFLKFIT